MSSNWFKHLVNAHQAPQDRRAKYAVARAHDLNRNQSTRLKDWRWSKIARILGYASVEDIFAIFDLDFKRYLDLFADYEEPEGSNSTSANIQNN